ncbi:MAG: hypothetical protein EBZ53_02265 [Verrucomicrobia bacterium]|nr:hypothetical protein [Verrucomicrobiota bacterium]
MSQAAAASGSALIKLAKAASKNFLCTGPGASSEPVSSPRELPCPQAKAVAGSLRTQSAANLPTRDHWTSPGCEISQLAAAAGSRFVHSPRISSSVFWRLAPGRLRAQSMAAEKFFRAWGGATATVAAVRADAERSLEAAWAAAEASLPAQT